MALLIAACGAGEPAKHQLLDPTEQAALADGSVAPPAAVLDRVMQIIVDQNVSPNEKVALVEDSDADRDVFEKISNQEPATYRFVPPLALDETNRSAHANVEVRRVNAPVYRAEVPLVYTEGSWKIGKAPFCLLLVPGSTQMCPSGP
ncbi:MAG: hypothetical protein C0482_02320 [Gordonia sp.]|nr:hypothetical protein [Gordonia sp. (in: high G+C Gram-positive bacteria)]